MPVNTNIRMYNFDGVRVLLFLHVAVMSHAS